MQTLAQVYPDIHADLEVKGYKCIAHLMTVFNKQTQMDQALGLRGATSNWCRGKNVPAMTVEKKASDFIARRALGQSAKPSPAPPMPKIEVQAPKPEEEDATFLVVGPAKQAEKIQRIVSLLGCEVVPV